jgi:hypothetical protein
MNRLANLLLASTLAASMTIPAAASAQDSYRYRSDQYQDSSRDRNDQPQDSYRDRNDQYQADQAAYNAQMRDYNAARDQYDRDRAAYDRRYGSGSYERTYGRFDRDAPSPSRAYVDTTATLPPPSPEAGACAQARADAKSSRIGGTVLGAIIGGALGSNIAAGGHRNDGTLVGAAVGGVIGNKAGGNTRAGRYSAACDHQGSYYTYDQTYPYREGRDWVPRGDHPARYYSQNRCRLAPAETDSGEYRYVRVCPDHDGRYRLAT